MKPLAAITGATGFLGRHVVKCLIDNGWRLRLLVRQDPRLDYRSEEPVELILGTLSDKAALAALVKDSDVVIHMAGLIKAVESSNFEETNVNGTRRLVDAIQSQSLEPGLVFVSSLAAREPALSSYAATKAKAEKIVQDHVEKTIVLRPCAIYGPWDKETLILFKSVRWPYQPVFNDDDARICMVHVADVAEAITASAAHLLREPISNGPFEVTDKQTQGYSWRELIEAACHASSEKARPLKISRSVTRMLGAIGDTQAALFGSAQMLTSDKVREIQHKDWTSCENAQLPNHLWQPRISLPEGFENTIRWYRDRKWLD